MELSKRLQAVADLLSEGLRVADIGCDHGFMSIYLVQTKKASGCIAMDINRRPLERAKENIDRWGLSTYIQTRISDGAKALLWEKDAQGERRLETDSAVLAGMGGPLMIRIMEASRDKFQEMKEFVLQPQSDILAVRRFIRSQGWRITAEDMVLEEEKFYPMMRVEPVVWERIEDKSEENGKIQQEIFDLFGEDLLMKKNIVLKQFLEKEKRVQEEILNRLLTEDTIRSRQRREEIWKYLGKVELGLRWFKDEMQ